MTPHVPRLAEKLIAWSLPPEDRDAVLGDLAEELATLAAGYGPSRARRWYWRQVRRSLMPNLRRRVRGALARRPVTPRHARPHTWTEGFMMDLKDAIRALRATPGFTVVALVVLTLGIGATTAIFSVVDAVVLRALPFDEHDRLVAVGERRPLGASTTGDPLAVSSIATPNYFDWVAQQQVFESMAGWTPFGARFTLSEAGDEPEDLLGIRVTAGIFDVLQVRPALGRPFVADDEIEGRHRVAVLSDALWRRRFAGDPGIVGRMIALDTGNYEVVGILPPGAIYPVGEARPTDLWVPYVMPPRERIRDPGGRVMLTRGIARLKPGVSLAEAQANMDQIAAGLEQTYPDWNKDNRAGVRPLHDHLVGSGTKSWLIMLLGAVAIVLLIACANVANLLLARATGREREMAVRAALGAGRSRLIRQLLVESLVLSTAGTIAATLVAWWAVQILRTAMPEGVPRVASITVDLRVLAAAAVLSLLTALLFGVAPAVQLTRPALTTTLKDYSPGSGIGRGRQRLRSGLVVAEVALAVVLLVGASLFIGSFVALLRIDPGFDPDRVLVVQIQPRGEPGKRGPDAAPAFTQLAERVGQAAGVVHASIVVGGLPLAPGNSTTTMAIPGTGPADKDPINVRAVTPDYHRALRIPLRRGRMLERSDRDGITNVVVINESAANKYFPGQDPVGRVVTLSRSERTVVGVVGDVHQSSLEIQPRPEAYEPMAQTRAGSAGELVVRTSGDPYSVLPAIRSAVRETLPGVPLRNVRTMEQVVAGRMVQRRLNMLLLGLFGLLGLVISAAGVYGVMAQTVASRTREIGVRMALGATPSDVVGMILRNAGVLVVIGLIIGGLAAWSLSATAKSFLFGLQADDPRAFAVAVVVLAASALIASAVPARRAASVDPAVVLRTE